MARSPKQKLKLLYLRDYLLRYSDENHPLTISDMISYLASHDIPAERKSLYDDIAALESYGLDIAKIRSRATGYYIASRDFQLPEIKLLVDAVQSSRFITQTKTVALVKKIEGLASIHESQFLHRQVVVQNRVKSMNESAYYNVDVISEAIAGKVKIRFKYFEYGHDKRRRFRHSGAYYEVSPEFMVWDDENYYLVACPTGETRPRHYRVDKMSDISLTALPLVSSGADPAKYTNALFGMYAGQERNVRIKFANSLAGVVIDRFGKDVTFVPFGKEHFTATVAVSVSPQFMAWVFALGTGAQVLSPADVREGMRQYLHKCIAMYEE